MEEGSLLGNGRLQYRAGRVPLRGLMLWQLQTTGRGNVRSNVKKKCQETSGSTKACEETQQSKDDAEFGRGKEVVV